MFLCKVVHIHCNCNKFICFIWWYLEVFEVISSIERTWTNHKIWKKKCFWNCDLTKDPIFLIGCLSGFNMIVKVRYMALFVIHMHVQPLDWLKNCLIHSTIFNYNNCGFRFQNQSWDWKLHEVEGNILFYLL